ncbi:hypothetical protein [Singulisphaera sp. PoT]|uniref:hypothetical protein n=1 Tax=Singulisphaera sp. PoT TaxID=3411797 RepID=UPI003BF58BC8
MELVIWSASLSLLPLALHAGNRIAVNVSAAFRRHHDHLLIQRRDNRFMICPDPSKINPAEGSIHAF